MRKMLGIAVLPLMPVLWIVHLHFWPSLYRSREMSSDYDLSIWHYWKNEFWR